MMENKAIAARATATRERDRTITARDEKAKELDTIERDLYYAQMNLSGQTVVEPGGIRRVLKLLTNWRPESAGAIGVVESGITSTHCATRTYSPCAGTPVRCRRCPGARTVNGWPR